MTRPENLVLYETSNHPEHSDLSPQYLTLLPHHNSYSSSPSSRHYSETTYRISSQCVQKEFGGIAAAREPKLNGLIVREPYPGAPA